MIKVELLKKYGAVEKHLHKGQTLFQEGDKAVFYYQILDGTIKMNNYNENGQETIQGLFNAGQSFGEPAVFGEFEYPANAEAVKKTHLICLEKNLFKQLLKENADVSFIFLKTLSKRLRFKAIISKEVKSQDAEHQLMTLLEYLKQNANPTTKKYCVDITRQTLANLTGLRVETVIRTIKKLAADGKIEIKNRKIYL